MNTTGNEYPVDEFDRLVDARMIRGARRRKESNLKWWPVLVAVVILASITGWAISNYIGSSEEEPTPTASTKEVPSDTPSGASPTAGPGGDPSSSGGNKPSEPSKPSENPSADASATPSGQESSASADVGIGRPIPALNGSKRPGSTTTGKQKLKKADYTKVSANNYSGGSPTVLNAFYVRVSDARVVEQIAAVLSVRLGNVVLTLEATGDDQAVVALRIDAG